MYQKTEARPSPSLSYRARPAPPTAGAPEGGVVVARGTCRPRKAVVRLRLLDNSQDCRGSGNLALPSPVALTAPRMTLPAFVIPMGTPAPAPPPPVVCEAGCVVPAPVRRDPNRRTRCNDVHLDRRGHNFEDLRRCGPLCDQLTTDERARDKQRRDQATYRG